MLDAQLKQMFALEDTKREQETEIAETEWKIAEVDEEVWSGCGSYCAPVSCIGMFLKCFFFCAQPVHESRQW
jgi:hypothetical protein